MPKIHRPRSRDLRGVVRGAKGVPARVTVFHNDMNRVLVAIMRLPDEIRENIYREYGHSSGVLP